MFWIKNKLRNRLNAGVIGGVGIYHNTSHIIVALCCYNVTAWERSKLEQIL